MSRQTWTKRDPIKTTSPSPTRSTLWDYPPGAVVVYGYLMRRRTGRPTSAWPATERLGRRWE